MYFNTQPPPPTTPADNFNALLQGIEQYHPWMSLSTMAGRMTGDPIGERLLLKDLRAMVDAAPLYALTADAVARSNTLALERFATTPFYIPTLPTAGATLADAASALYLQVDDGAAEHCHAYTKAMHERGMTDSVMVRMIEGRRVPLPNGTNSALLMYGNILIGKVGGSTAFSVANLDVCLRQGSAFGGVSIWATREGQMKATRWSLASPTSVPQMSALPHGDYKQLSDDACKSVRTVLEQLAFIDMPCHYVVEERPQHLGDDRTAHAVKAARYDDRERWVILDPEGVRQKFAERSDVAEGTHAPPAPHLRRAHDRVLRSDRYTYKRGAVLHIRPTWIGEREWKTRGMRYRVVSRVGATDTQA